MRLLFDENLSPKLPNRLNNLFPNSLHVRDVGMKATLILGQANFFLEFDVCFFRARSEFEVRPK